MKKKNGRHAAIERVAKQIRDNKNDFICFGPQSIIKSYACTFCEKRKLSKNDPPIELYAHFKRKIFDRESWSYKVAKRGTSPQYAGTFCSKECEHMFILAVS